MKGIKIILVVLVLFVFLNLVGEVKEGRITAKSTFDIRAVQVIGTDISLIIDNDPPEAFIDSPLNKTYNYNSINLNFTAFDSSSDMGLVWYNLNHAGNVTLTGNITFMASEGSNTIHLFANDTFGFLNDSKSVTFLVNTSKGYNITHTKFTESTTNFNSLSKQQQANASDVKLYVPSYGKISFNENISIVSDLDIDSYVDIGDNLITINSNNLPNFNKSATLEIYGLSFANPKIRKDGTDCPLTICKINNYSGGILSFNVTHFTTYSAAETSTVVVTPGGGSPSGGGSSSSGRRSLSEVDNIDIDRDSVKISMKLDETKTDYIIIKNKEDKKIKLTLTLNPEINFVFIESGLNKYSFDIDALESRSAEIRVRAHGEDGVKEGVYVSKLIIEGGNFKKILPVVIEVESKGPTLFDVEVAIPDEYSIIEPGERVMAKILLLNLGVTGTINANIDYEVLDFDGNVILKDSEVQGVETKFQKIKELIIPRDTKLGKYVLSIKVTYYEGEKERVATATHFFEVGKRGVQFPFNIKLNLYTVVIIILVILLIMFVAYHFGLLKVLNHHSNKGRKRKT